MVPRFYAPFRFRLPGPPLPAGAAALERRLEAALAAPRAWSRAWTRPGIPWASWERSWADCP